MSIALSPNTSTGGSLRQCMHSTVNGSHIRPGVLICVLIRVLIRVKEQQSLKEHNAKSTHVDHLAMEASCQAFMLLKSR